MVGTLTLIALGCFVSPWFLVPLGAYFLAVFVGALISVRTLSIALTAVPAAIIQLGGYGCGFIKAWFLKILLRRGRNIEEEIILRKGK